VAEVVNDVTNIAFDSLQQCLLFLSCRCRCCRRGPTSGTTGPTSASTHSSCSAFIHFFSLSDTKESLKPNYLQLQRYKKEEDTHNLGHHIHTHLSNYKTKQNGTILGQTERQKNKNERGKYQELCVEQLLKKKIRWLGELGSEF
jgi:hypothetical protein